MASNSAFSNKSNESSKVSKTLPPVLLSHKVRTLIGSVKEMQLITTYEEVLDGLGQYIANKNLYDPKNNKVCCKGDDLGSVLGTEEFSMSDLNVLLPRIAVPVSKNSNYSAGSAALLRDNPLKRKLDGELEYDRKKISSMASTSPVLLHIPPSPTYCDLSDSVESIQGYETAYAKDTSDEFLSAENGEVLAIEETFDIEYEVESDSSNSALSDNSSESDAEDLINDFNLEEAILKFLTGYVYKPKPDSDIEFFADASSDDDEQSDAEITEFDFWSCPKCNIKNRPTVRYCLKCFLQRRNWLPDKPLNMKRKNRTSRFNIKGNKDKPLEASLSNCHQDSQESCTSTGVSCEIKESSSNPSSLKSESVGSCKTDPEDSSSVLSRDSHCMKSQVVLDVFDVESLDLIDGEFSGSLCMSSSDSPSMKFLCSSSMKSCGSSSMKSTISSNWDSSGPSSTESYGPSSMESGIYSQESSGTSSMELSCPSSLECADSSQTEKYDSGKLCMICCSEPVNASIIHGKFAHQISCYKCARKVQKEKKPCPVCRRAIDRVVIQVNM